MRKFPILTLLAGGCFGASMMCVQAAGLAPSKSKFYYKDQSGKTQSARIVRHYYYKKIPAVHPAAKLDPRIDPRLRKAATIAEERSNARSKSRCWHYVKTALTAAGAVSSYPKTAYAWQAGDELVRNYGFKKLSVRDPYKAPIGAVLVYSHGKNGAGHVEIRTRTGFVSDYHSKNRCRYPLLAVFAKFSS